MLKIGDFSKLSRISIRMLRHYDEIGLLIPNKVDNFTGYRYYSEGQLLLANRISSLKNMGFSLAAILEINAQYDDSGKLRSFLQIKLSEVLEQAAETENRLRLLESTINRLGKGENIMKYDVVFKELPRKKVASVRQIIPTYNDEGMLWQILMEETAPLSIQYDNPCLAIAVFHDEGFKESNVDIEVRLSVSGDYNNTENVVFKTVDPIQMASATYKGSYDQISKVNEAVAAWIMDNGYEFDGSMFNIYHVSPHEEANPDNYVTEVCCPVRSR